MNLSYVDKKGFIGIKSLIEESLSQYMYRVLVHIQSCSQLDILA